MATQGRHDFMPSSHHCMCSEYSAEQARFSCMLGSVVLTYFPGVAPLRQRIIVIIRSRLL